MSDGTDPASIAVGAGVAGAVALGFAFLRGLFARNVDSHDRALVKLEQELAATRLELRSMHDEQTRQRGEIGALGKDGATASTAIRAAHDRIDALVSPTPRGKR